MDTAVKPLADDPSQLHAEGVQLRGVIAEYLQRLADQMRQIQEKDRRIEQLLDYLLLLRKRRFGASADRPNPDQFTLFDEAELAQLLAACDQPVEAEPALPAQGVAPKEDAAPRKPVRRPLPADLHRIEKIIDLPETEKQALGEDWKCIGYDCSEQLAVIPRQHYVIEYKRAKYAPVNDAVAVDLEANGEATFRIAPRAPQLLPKAIAHHSVIADVVVRKFVDGLPLYRQEAIYAREGIELSRQTLSGWLILLHARLAPLMASLKQALYQGRVLHIDETRLQVLNEPGRDNSQQSYMWVYRGGLPDKPVIWFHYAESRSGQVPISFLYPDEGGPATWALYLLTDGYSGYNALAAKAEILGHAACWTHVRRKFVEATEGRNNSAAAHQMLALIGKLYQIERAARDQTPEERQAYRQAQARPLLDKIKSWLDQKQAQALPKSLLGKAITYTLGLWPQLTTYLADGHIEIDNNRAENAIRPFVIGRKNFLFSGSPRGAEASATLYSLIETAKANGHEPWAYLNYLFERLPSARTEQDLRQLLPLHVDPELTKPRLQQ